MALSGGPVHFLVGLILAGSAVDAGVGVGGPDGQVQVGGVGQAVGDDGVGGDVSVVAAGQVTVAAGQFRAGGQGLAVGAGEGEGAARGRG
jgi:hypothetical protein